MSNVCDICGKSPQFGFNVSHSHKKTKRRWTPNVHKMRIVVDGSPRNARVCSKCVKAGKVQKVSHSIRPGSSIQPGSSPSE